MKSLKITASSGVKCNSKQWVARYTVLGAGEARLVRIESRSSINVVVAKVLENGFLGPQNNYYISCPNFGVAIPEIPSLEETHWITEQLIRYNMSAPDAVTVATVLAAIGDF